MNSFYPSSVREKRRDNSREAGADEGAQHAGLSRCPERSTRPPKASVFATPKLPELLKRPPIEARAAMTWSDEETGDPLYADLRATFTWSRSGARTGAAGYFLPD